MANLNLLSMRASIVALLALGICLAGCGGSNDSASLDSINSDVQASTEQLNTALGEARATNRTSMVNLQAAASASAETISNGIEEVDSLDADGENADEIESYRKALVAQRAVAQALAAGRPSSSQIELAAAKATLALNSVTGQQLTAIDVSALVHSLKKSRKKSAPASSGSSGSGNSDSATSSDDATRTFYVGQGNISCSVSAASAKCSVASNGITFVVEGGSRGMTEDGAILGRASGSRQAYGTSVSVGDFTCSIPPESQASGVSCRNTSSGHGFEASRVGSRQKTF